MDTSVAVLDSTIRNERIVSSLTFKKKIYLFTIISKILLYGPRRVILSEERKMGGQSEMFIIFSKKFHRGWDETNFKFQNCFVQR